MRLIATAGILVIFLCIAPLVWMLQIYKGTTYIPTSGFVPQGTAYNCGPAALRMVFEHDGFTISEEAIAFAADTQTTGTTLAGLIRAAEQFGYDAVASRLRYGDLMSVELPAVAFMPSWKHYVVLKGIDETGVWLIDPARGHFHMTRRTFAYFWDGVVLELRPQPSSSTAES